MLTFITPVASHHLPLLGRCVDSVKAQTAAVEHLIEVDVERRGPGVIRNRLLKQVVTEYVSFVDADDWIEPDFAEKTLAAVGQKYCYTDWWQDDEVIQAPECAWINKTFHLVTAVVPTAWVLAVGGFDETLDGMEDTDLWVKLATRGFCGKRLPLPLVHYRAKGGRAETIHTTGTVELLAAEMQRRYGGFRVGCCGNDVAETTQPVGDRQPGDVLAQAQWGGNRSVMGLVTGRHYPRTSRPKTCYVDPRDVDASPNLWRQITEVDTVTTQTQTEIQRRVVGDRPRGLDALGARLIPTPKLDEPKPRAVPQLRGDVEVKPDIARVKRLAGKGRKTQNEVWFVRPEKDYPSYADFWRLVELSGYSTCSVTYAAKNLNNSTHTFIFVTPEETLDCTGATARCIFWQFEYAGDYTQQKNRETCSEQWSSDPYNAQVTGARYVLLGSHPGLKTGGNNGQGVKWDVVTLSYLTDRRRSVYRFIAAKFAPDYPGHDGAARDEQLRCSRLLLHVNQHDEPALAPIKLALAAAYQIPVIAEAVIDPGPYAERVLFCNYESVPNMVSLYLSGKLEADYLLSALYQLLCVEHPFRACVDEALAKQEARVAA
jgi:hypothetical protein